MNAPESYVRIHEEFLQQQARASSNTLRQLLTKAVGKTESSYIGLGVLKEAFQPLLVKLENGCLPGTIERVEQVLDGVEFLRQQERAAKNRFLGLELEGHGDSDYIPPFTPIEIPDDAGPEFRDWAENLNEMFANDRPIKSAAKSLKEEIESYRAHIEHGQGMANNIMAIGVTANSAIFGVLATGNLWLQHVLLNRIYDTKETSFEQRLAKDKRTAVLETFISQLLGWLPGFGIATSLTKLFLTLRDLRSNRWSDADSSLRFVETYLSLHAEWDANCAEYSEKYSTAVSKFG